jgi:adenylate cyclase
MTPADNNRASLAADEENLTPLLTWLAEAALRDRPVNDTIAGTCDRLNALGYDIARSHVATSALHPMMASYMWTWRPGEPLHRTDIPHGHAPGAAWLASPLHHMLTQKQYFMRRSLIDETDSFEFEVFDEFAADGMTEWAAVAEGFSLEATNVPGGEFGIVVSWTTRAPRGFRQDRIGGLRLVAKTLAVAIKSSFLTEIAREVLGAYLGADAARRVLSGSITRGATGEVPAAVMMADLKGFTRLSQQTSITDVVGHLNAAFDIVSGCIAAHNGTVLKLIGDGVLAVFLQEDRSAEDAAGDALRAADAIQGSLPPGVAIDIGLGFGNIHYGNIGAAGRLDFTAIGPPVNEASRLESLCGVLNQPVLTSSSMAFAAPEAMKQRIHPVGLHALKGFDEPREVFALELIQGG